MRIASVVAFFAIWEASTRLASLLTGEIQVTNLPEDLMVKMDIASMANSLEGRSPFLDHEVMELAYRLPGEWKLRGTDGTITQ